MTLFSYVVRYDSGLAQNPFWGYSTLATCKPEIRRLAQPRDWILSTGSARTVGCDRVVYAMRVAEVLPFEEYDRDPRFRRKRQSKHGTARRRAGDNIYYRTGTGKLQQRPSRHGPEDRSRDLRGRYALIGTEF
jgi:putative DNA base modification enzyme with NMAD domain